MFKQKNILLIVSGGIAVYKACDLTSKLTQQGANVRVIMTNNATKLVSPLTFQALSRNPVYIDTFDEKDPKKIAHIDVADWADIAIIAPATANIIGKLASGVADDMATTTLLATQAKVYIAPAMNVHMYEHPAVVNNLNQLEQWGYTMIEPGTGYLACGYEGKGRLAEPQTIIDAIHNDLTNRSLLARKRILVTAGPTRETLDPVRFFSNRSSGKMGFAIAEAAAHLGADVTLVTGPVSLKVDHPSIQRIDVISAEEMYHMVMKHFSNHHIIIKAAAVADYRPKIVHDEKMKKQSDDMMIEMERTKDILQSLGENKTDQYIVGFAAETTNPIENGIGKLKKKNLDAIVVNDISTKGAGFEGDTNIVTFIDKHLESTEIDLAPKSVIAEKILTLIQEDMKR